MTIIDCLQGSPEWYQARLGIPTASMFEAVMAKGKKGGKSLTRESYMHKLAGEILTGEPMESYSNGNMERGKAMEDEARDAYVFQTGADPKRVGFVRMETEQAGCSPDSLLLPNMYGLEIKSAAPHVQIERLLQNRLPPEHVAQVQGGMWVCEAAFWDFVSYCPRLPLLVVRVPRDDGKIAEIAGAVRQFNAELTQVVERIRGFA
jgi:hypothetical protein